MTTAITLQPLVEVVDPTVKPCTYWRYDPHLDTEIYETEGHRPLETEADRIAAALPMGDNVVRFMADLFEDGARGSTEENPWWDGEASTAYHDLDRMYPNDVTREWGVAP